MKTRAVLDHDSGVAVTHMPQTDTTPTVGTGGSPCGRLITLIQTTSSSNTMTTQQKALPAKVNYIQNINKLLYGGGILCHLQYINLSYFPCPDTNGSLIHNFPPYINGKILMKY